MASPPGWRPFWAPSRRPAVCRRTRDVLATAGQATAPPAGGRREERGGGGGGGAPPGAFRVAMAADGRLAIHWNRPDGRLHLVAAPSHRKIPVDLAVSSPDGSGEGRWDRDAGVLEIRRLGSDAVLLEAEGWPGTIALLPKRSVA